MSTSPSFLERFFGRTDEQEFSPKTFEYQETLPKVPLPNLEYSCAAFMEWCSPILTDEERKHTQDALDQFSMPSGPGEKLHDDLLKYANSPGVKSWLDRFWETRYLGRRDPIALNANFFFMLENKPVNIVERASDIIQRALYYKLQLDQEKIPPSMQRGQPLCMKQNKALFSESRIPGEVQDTVREPYSDAYPGPSQAEHILVFHNGHMFRMDVIGASGKPYHLEDFKRGLEAILDMASEPMDTEYCIGHLTTKPRANWAKTRQVLRDFHPDNAKALEVIDSSLFVINLDKINPENDQVVTDNLLHGDSSSRWFDKSLQFIVFGNGSAGVNIEHCRLDGTAILNLIDTMLAYGQAEITKDTSRQGTPEIRPILFQLDDVLRQQVVEAGYAFQKLSENAATLNFVFDRFGTSTIKTFGVSPDAFAQLGFQLAHYRTKGFVGATYESIATRAYESGRTEAMRVMTDEIMRFIEAFANDMSDEEKVSRFKAAAKKHVERAKQCQAGQAPEQHLWELLNIYNAKASELGIEEELTFYETPGWNKLRSDCLSTSSAPSKNVKYFGFGSTGSECIGVGYILAGDQIRAYLSTPQKYEDTLPVFAENLKASYVELAGLLGGEG